jgi:DNA repair protein RecO (recombination protein O)
VTSLTPAFVLHRKPFSDSSLLVDFFTLQQGRVTCIAKGVKQGKNRKAAILQPFIPLMISLSGRGEVKTLRECEAVENALCLQGITLYSAFYTNELLLKFLQKHEAHEMVFAAYAELLQQLVNAHDSVEALLRIFEVKLLAELGYGLQLSHDAEKSLPIDPRKYYVYELERGPIEVFPGSAFHHGKPLVAGKTLLALLQAELNEQQQIRESKELMRYIIQHLLGGYNFKSREFFTARF